VAGKTGTTNDEYDTWFGGYTPDLAVVVWVGFDRPRSLGLAASRVALPIWVRFVKEATGGAVAGHFEPPAEVEEVEIDPASGARALTGCPRHEPTWFVRGTVPSETCPGFRLAWPDFFGDEDDEDAGPSDGPREEEAQRPTQRNWLRRIIRRLGADE